MSGSTVSTLRKTTASVPKDSVTGSIPMRTLGRTGERVSAIGLGGFHLGKPDLREAESIRIIRAAIDAGINFLDNSWDYNDGRSEIRMGKALRDGYRERAFLMTKIDGQTRTAAARQIEESLRRLQTDVIDLLQLHEVIRMKPLGDRQIPASNTVSPVEALHYAMNLPTSVVITGCDSMEILEQAVQAGRTFRPMSPKEVRALLAKTARAAHAGAFERYKTTHEFDSTVAHPEWLR